MDRPPIIHQPDPITLPMAAAALGAKRPTWATVIAVIGIVFAVLELLSAIGTPLQIIMQRLQQQMLSNPQFMSALTSQPALTISAGSTVSSTTTGPTVANPANAAVNINVPGARVRVGSTARGAGVATTQVAVGMPPAFAAIFQQITTPPPWFETYMIANGVECLIAGILLLVGSILLLQQRAGSRIWLIGYAAISLLWTAVIIVLAAASKNIAFANQAMCASSCGAPLPLVLCIMLLLPAQRDWFARRRQLERTARPVLH